MRSPRTALCIITALCAVGAKGAAERATPTVEISPKTIRMGAFYGGARVRIKGNIRPGSELVAVIRGGEREEVFNRRRHFGIIWIVSGKVHISGVPSLFLRFSDQPVRKFLSRQAMDEHQLDEAAIKRQMHIQPEEDTDVILASWITLKAQDGTYALTRGAVKMGEPTSEMVPYTVEFDWPRKARPGVYQLRVYECRDMEVVGTASATLPVEKVGFPAWLADIALRHSLIYGVVAVIVAAVFGFGIDWLTALIFARKAPAH